MRFALSDLEFDIKGSGTKAVFHSNFLTLDERNKVQAFIQFLDQNQGRKKADISFEILENLFPSYKTVKSLQISSTRYYTYSSQTIEDILGRSNQREKPKSSTDITSFITESATRKDSISRLTPAQFRARVFWYA